MLLNLGGGGFGTGRIDAHDCKTKFAVTLYLKHHDAAVGIPAVGMYHRVGFPPRVCPCRAESDTYAPPRHDGPLFCVALNLESRVSAPLCICEYYDFPSPRFPKLAKVLEFEMLVKLAVCHPQLARVPRPDPMAMTRRFRIRTRYDAVNLPIPIRLRLRSRSNLRRTASLSTDPAMLCMQPPSVTKECARARAFRRGIFNV